MSISTNNFCRARAGAGNHPQPLDETQIEGTFEDWTDVREWLDADFINWVKLPFFTFQCPS